MKRVVLCFILSTASCLASSEVKEKNSSKEVSKVDTKSDENSVKKQKKSFFRGSSIHKRLYPSKK